VGHDKRRRGYKSEGLKICGKGNPVPASTEQFSSAGICERRMKDEGVVGT
jgi:hypothetical protein